MEIAPKVKRTTSGFQVLSRRWVVERTLKRIGRNRMTIQRLRRTARSRRSLNIYFHDTFDA